MTELAIRMINKEKTAKNGLSPILILEKKGDDYKKEGLKVGFGLKDLTREKKLGGPYFDLGVGFWLLDPDIRDYSPEYVFKRFLKKEWEGTPADLNRGYQWLLRELEEKRLIKVFREIEMPLLPVLAQMERAGILVNGEKLKKLKTEIGREIGELEKKIYQLAGERFNLNSPKQMGEILFNKLKIDKSRVRKTAGGAVSTSHENLKRIEEKHEIVPLILDYRESFKILSTYVEPILERRGEDGRLRTTYLQTGTGTGRLASENPNLQNIPQESKWAKSLREVFEAGKRNRFVSFDYSQMELRVLAAVAHDGKMIEAFKEGRDIHATTAANIFNVPADKIDKKMRRVAKVLNFGIAYGMGPRAFGEAAGITPGEAKKFIEEYFNDFTAIKRWQEGVKREARELGYVKTLSGRRRMVSDIDSGAPQMRAAAERVAINMPIQGLEADIMKKAMIGVDNWIQKENLNNNVKMLLQVHDELLFEVKEDLVKKIAPEIVKIMESVIKLSVPIAAEAKIGNNWGELRVFPKRNA